MIGISVRVRRRATGHQHLNVPVLGVDVGHSLQATVLGVHELLDVLDFDILHGQHLAQIINEPWLVSACRQRLRQALSAAVTGTLTPVSLFGTWKEHRTSKQCLSNSPLRIVLAELHLHLHRSKLRVNIDAEGAKRKRACVAPQ